MSENNGDEVLEGLWDCPNCSTTNRGLEMQCTGCGAVRTDDVKFYLPDDARKIEDKAELDRAAQGPDWVCGYCSTSNVAGATSGKQCGAPAEDGEKRQVSEVKPEKPADDSNVPPKKESSSSLPMFIGLGLVAVLVLCCVLGIIFGGSKTEAMQVASTRWESRIHWEKSKWVSEVGQPGARRPSSLDRNIRNIRQETRMITVTKTVKKPKVKKINNGNGTFTKKTVMVDVKEKVKEKALVWVYDRRKWVKQTPKVAQGPPSKTPTFPQVVFGGSTERMTKKEIAFQVIFKAPKSGDQIIFEGISGEAKKDPKDLAPHSLEELKAFKAGDKYKVTYSGKKASKIEKL